MSANELLPCPFCGKLPEEADRASSERPGGRIYFIVCRCGGFTASAHQHGQTKAEVTAKWNTRTAPAAAPGPLECQWEARCRWLMEQATYSGGGNGGTFTITFKTPLDAECDIAQLDAAMARTAPNAQGRDK